jgi:ABC-type arginine/histidine transport system permease subunit
MRGTYMTLDQAAYVTPILQGAVFAFPRKAPGD